MYKLGGMTVYVVYTSIHSVVYSKVHGMLYNLHLIAVHKHSILYGSSEEEESVIGGWIVLYETWVSAGLDV